MTITNIEYETGVFSGTYVSAIGTKKSYVLGGCLDTGGRALGWTVNWQNENTSPNSLSARTWSGQLQKTPSGEYNILTTWLLTTPTTPENNWESTQMGFDTFSQTAPMQETEHHTKLRLHRSQPSEA